MSIDEVKLDFSVLKRPRTDLTPDQFRAVNLEGNIITEAGPGSGKTDVLTLRAERLFKEGRKPLCLTHTRHAAEEMRSRLLGVEVSTIHSFCYRNVGWDESYSKMLLDYKGKAYKEKWTDVLIDEGQDLSELQLEVLLSIPADNYFIVLDPYQSIYIGDWTRVRAAKDPNANVTPDDLIPKRKLGAMGRRTTAAVEQFIKIYHKITLKENFRSNKEVVSSLEKVYKRGLVPMGPRNFGTTGIFCRWNKEVLQVSNELKKHLIPHYYRLGGESGGKITTFGESPKIHVMVLHSNKGKQFDYSIIFDWNEDSANGEEDLNLLYVAVARASKSAHIIEHRQLSMPIGWARLPNLCLLEQEWLDLLEGLQDEK